MSSIAAAKEPRRKYLSAASAERAEARRKPVMAYTPRLIVSRATKSISMSLADTSRQAPAVLKASRG
jgi:hypothetical protein